MKAFRKLSAALAVILVAWMGPCGATVVVIDDLTEVITVSINGVNITTPGQTVGTFPNLQEVTGFLVTAGSPTAPETAIVSFTDHSILTSQAEQFQSPQLLLIDPVTGLISDSISLFIQRLGFSGATRFSVRMDSDFEGTGLTCTNPPNAPPRCVIFGNETGDFQDVSAALLGNSGVSGLQILVRSEVDVASVPEPATLLLLAAALAGFAGSGAWRKRRIQ